MTKLTDTQAILLSTASQRGDGSVLPLPASLKPGVGTSKALAALMKNGLVEEREASEATAVHRTDGDLRFALVLTPAGAHAIGIEPSGSTSANHERAASRASSTPKLKRVTKADQVLALLNRNGGATLPELIEATSWLPHTTRAALTGLRKKGHELARTKRDGATCYRVVEQA